MMYSMSGEHDNPNYLVDFIVHPLVLVIRRPGYWPFKAKFETGRYSSGIQLNFKTGDMASNNTLK